MILTPISTAFTFTSVPFGDVNSGFDTNSMPLQNEPIYVRGPSGPIYEDDKVVVIEGPSGTIRAEK